MIAELLEGGQAHLLRRPRDLRGRLAADPGAELRGGGGRAAGLLDRLGEPAADQGQPQCDALGDRGGQGGGRGTAAGRESDRLEACDAAVRGGELAKDLKRVRNVKPIWSRLGLWPSLVLGGFDMWVANLTGWNPLGTWKHGKTDTQATGKGADYTPIDYPKPDGKLSFDRPTNVAFSFINHEESQPATCGCATRRSRSR